MRLKHRLSAEFVGTFWLVLGGCGSALFALNVAENLGIGLLGVSLAFGLTVLTMAYALGHVSGGHFNPAVTVGLVLAKRFAARDALPYIGAQLLGAVVGATVLFVVANDRPGFSTDNGFAANGYGAHSPNNFGLMAALIVELVLTAGFVTVILGVTDHRAPVGFGPLAIGLALTLIHLVSIPIDNTSVNPARSTGQALFAGGWALQQLWLFWLAPLVGGAVAGLGYRFLTGEVGDEPDPAAASGREGATAVRAEA